MVSNTIVVVGSDGEDPLTGAHVEAHMDAVRARMGRTFYKFTPAPPTTALDIEMIRLQLNQEKRRVLIRVRLMVQMWKTIKVIFYCFPLTERFPDSN